MKMELPQRWAQGASIALFVVALLFFAGVASKVLYHQVYASPLWQPSLRCDHAVLDLGSVPAGAVVPCRFEIANVGRRPLIISRVSSGCSQCLKIVAVPTGPIAPGCRDIIEVQFLTLGLHGRVIRTAIVHSNDLQHPTIVLKVKAHISEDGADRHARRRSPSLPTAGRQRFSKAPL